MLCRWQTTRWRIALWNALGTAGITLATLAAVRQGVRWTIFHEVDEILEEDSREIDLALQEVAPPEFHELLDELRRKSIGHRQHGWFVLLLDGADETLWRSERSPAALPAHSDTVRTCRREVAANPHGVRAVGVGASTQPLMQGLALVDRLTALAGLSVVVVAPAVGYLLAGRATRDVRRMSELAERLQPARLEQRLVLRGVDDEFDRLAHRINELLDRIAAYLAQRRDFLANAAHEMRSPLAAVRSSIEVALAKPRSAAEYDRLLETVLEENRSLEILVNQILLLSEAQALAETADPEPVDLTHVVRSAAEMFRAVAETRKVELAVDVEPDVRARGNRAHLRQVVNNLVDNAVKFGPPGTHVAVTLRRHPDAARARMVVADDGPGIPAADLPRIFERFYRVDRARSRDGPRGNGLGLSICQTIVEAHGGSLACSSVEGQGVAMTVDLPLDASR